MPLTNFRPEDFLLNPAPTEKLRYGYDIFPLKLSPSITLSRRKFATHTFRSIHPNNCTLKEYLDFPPQCNVRYAMRISERG